MAFIPKPFNAAFIPKPFTAAFIPKHPTAASIPKDPTKDFTPSTAAVAAAATDDALQEDQALSREHGQDPPDPQQQ